MGRPPLAAGFAASPCASSCSSKADADVTPTEHVSNLWSGTRSTQHDSRVRTSGNGTSCPRPWVRPCSRCGTCATGPAHVKPHPSHPRGFWWRPLLQVAPCVLPRRKKGGRLTSPHDHDQWGRLTSPHDHDRLASTTEDTMVTLGLVQ